MDATEWCRYFSVLIDFLRDSERQYNTGLSNQHYVQYAIEQTELSEQTCRVLMRTIASNQTLRTIYEHILTELLGCLRSIRDSWQELEDSAVIQQPQTIHTGTTGRPRFEIRKEQLEYLESLSFSWTEIASLIGVSRSTLYRRRLDFGLLVDPSTDISDEDLLAVIEEAQASTPHIGVSLMMGRLRSMGYKVTRERVRQSLRLHNPLGSALRWPGVLTQRRPYSVPGPNSLWHIDGHHKLIRWRFVTHGAIDGYSRLILFLKCSCDNRANTVLEQFLHAIQTFHVPSRIRTDQGMENVMVAQYMLEKRGINRGSVITGSSIHNQRIERLWRDVHHGVTRLFYRLFYYLEEQNMLDPINEKHLYALQYIFLPRINKALNEFRNAWNHHQIRSARHKSPHQLFVAGLILLRNSGLIAMDFFDEVDEETYGMDEDGPMPDIDGTVVVPQVNFQLTLDQTHHLHQIIDPLSTSQNYGIDLYEQTLAYIDNLQ